MSRYGHDLVARGGGKDLLKEVPRRSVEFVEVLTHLWKGGDSGRAVLNVLDTVVLSGSGQPDAWYFTSKTGIVMRKSAHATVINTVVQQFRAIAFRFPTISACIAHYGTRVEVLSDTEFTNLAKTALPPGLYVLQAYVLPRGARGRQYANYYHEWEITSLGKTVASSFKLGAEHLSSMPAVGDDEGRGRAAASAAASAAARGPVGAASVPRDRLIRSREHRVNDTLHAMTRVVARCVESRRHEHVVGLGAEFVMDQEGSLWLVRTTHVETVRPRDVARAERTQRRRDLHMLRPGDSGGDRSDGGGGGGRSPSPDRRTVAPDAAAGPHFLRDRLGPKQTPGGAALELARTDGSDAPGSVGLFGAGAGAQSAGASAAEGEADDADEMVRRAEGILREEELEKMLRARVCPGDYCQRDLAKIDPARRGGRDSAAGGEGGEGASLRQRLRREVGRETERAAAAWQRATSMSPERSRSRSHRRGGAGADAAAEDDEGGRSAPLRPEDVRLAISFHIIAEARLEKHIVGAYLEDLEQRREGATYGRHDHDHAMALGRAFPGYYYRPVRVCDACYAVYSRVQQAKAQSAAAARRRRGRGRRGAPAGAQRLRPLTQGPRTALARSRGLMSHRGAGGRSLPSLARARRPRTELAARGGIDHSLDRPDSAFGADEEAGDSGSDGGFSRAPPVSPLAHRGGPRRHRSAATLEIADDAGSTARSALLQASDAAHEGGEGLPPAVSEGLAMARRAMRMIGKGDIAELRTYASPPPSVALVAAAVTLLAAGEPLPWGPAKKLMANGERFLRLLAAVDRDRVPADRLRALLPILERRAFQPFALEGVSLAAARFCAWARGIAQYAAWRAGYPADFIASSRGEDTAPGRAAAEHRIAAGGGEEEVARLGRSAGPLGRTTELTSSGRWRPSRRDGEMHHAPGSVLSTSLRASVPGGTGKFRPATRHLTASRLRAGAVEEGARGEEAEAARRSPDRRQQAARRRIQDAQMKRLHRSNMGQGDFNGDTAVTAQARTFDCADGLTSLPYHVMGQPDIELRAPSFVVVHDLFDTFETMQILVSEVVKHQYGCQALLFNLPGQAMTRFTVGTTPAEARYGAGGGEVVLNNVFHADRMHELLRGLERSGEFVTSSRPFYVLGVGNGTNVATQFALRYGDSPAYASSLRAMLAVNPFAEIDPQHAAVLHSCVNVFSCFPADRPDLPVSYFSRFVFSEGYLQRVEPSMALNLYTAVSNPISLAGRLHLLRGALRHADMRAQLRSLRVPLVVVQSTENALVSPSSLDPFLEGRRVHHIWSHQHAAQGGLGDRGKDLVEMTVEGGGDDDGEGQEAGDVPRAVVVWLRAGHEVRQEQRQHVVEVIRVLAATGGVTRGQDAQDGAPAPPAASAAVDGGGELTGWGGASSSGAFAQEEAPLSREERRRALDEHSRSVRTVGGATPAERKMMETVSEHGIQEVPDSDEEGEGAAGRPSPRSGSARGGGKGGEAGGGKAAAAQAGTFDAAEEATMAAVWEGDGAAEAEDEEEARARLATPPRWDGERAATRHSDLDSTVRTAYAPEEVTMSTAGWEEATADEDAEAEPPARTQRGPTHVRSDAAEEERRAAERARGDAEYRVAVERVDALRREEDESLGRYQPPGADAGGASGTGARAGARGGQERAGAAEGGLSGGAPSPPPTEGACAEGGAIGGVDAAVPAGSPERGAEAGAESGVEPERADPGARVPRPERPDFDTLFSDLAAEEEKLKEEERRRLTDYRKLERARARQAAQRREEEKAKERAAASEVRLGVKVDEATANRAATCIQQGARGMLARRRVERMKAQRADAKAAAQGLVLVQAVVRGFLARRRAEQRRDRVEKEELERYAAVSIQRVGRGYVGRRRARRLGRDRAVVRIQSAWRGHMGRSRAARARTAAEEEALRAYAATKVQATWRMYAVMREHVERRIRHLAATEAQRVYRGHLGRRKAARRREWLGTAHGPQRLALGMRMIQESRGAFERHKHEIQALHREQEGLEAQATDQHSALRDAEAELHTLDDALQDMNTLDEDLQGLVREKERLEREARGHQVEIVPLGDGVGQGSAQPQRALTAEERKARASEAHQLEVALHVKRSERERKRRELEARFQSVFKDVEARREALRRVEDNVQDMEATRQRKEREFQRLQRNLMELLEEQKAELDSLRAKGIELEQATAQSAAAAAATASAVRDHEDRSAQLFSGTEELLKFQFMSMSLSYFSSLNMLKNLRGMNSDTAQAAMQATASSAAAAAAASGAASIPSLQGVSLGAADDLASAARLRERERTRQDREGEEAKEDIDTPFPENVREWAPKDVARWLRSVSLGQYAEAFLEGAVDGDFLLELRPEDLRDVLGVEHELHIKKILYGRDKLRPLSEQEQMRRGQIDHELRVGGASPYASPGRGGGGGGVVELGESAPAMEEVTTQCRNGRRGKVEEALDRGFEVDATDEHGNTLLLIAAQQVNRAMMEMLLERGADVNHQNNQGNTALHYAMVYDQDGSIGEFLISRGADDTLENRFGLSPYDGIAP